MRKGIPKALWKGVVTVYADGDKIQRFTGNQRPNNARVMLLDADGKVVYFYADGFSVDALNAVNALVKS
jgi:cytochrome oxidase Cu insertion factor (SCO1/SenC/PrrC family)